MPAINHSLHCSCVEQGELRSGLGHVNVMVDTLIANASVEDLRAIARALLASSPPSTATAFTAAAQARFKRTIVKKTEEPTFLFNRDSQTHAISPAAELLDLLRRARCLYGAGMGIESLHLLMSVVTASMSQGHGDGIIDGPTSDVTIDSTFALIDMDITQAVQSAKEQHGRGQIADLDEARCVINDMRSALETCAQMAREKGSEFPFEQGLGNLSYWKL